MTFLPNVANSHYKGVLLYLLISARQVLIADIVTAPVVVIPCNKHTFKCNIKIYIKTK
jgi:hypothetical protein